MIILVQECNGNRQIVDISELGKGNFLVIQTANQQYLEKVVVQ